MLQTQAESTQLHPSFESLISNAHRVESVYTYEHSNTFYSSQADLHLDGSRVNTSSPVCVCAPKVHMVNFLGDVPAVQACRLLDLRVHSWDTYTIVKRISKYKGIHLLLLRNE